MKKGLVRRRAGMVGRQLYYEQLSFWRNPFGAFFTLGFSLIFLILLAATGGSQRVVFLNVKEIQYYVPGFAAYGVMSACFNTLSISLVSRRESGRLKRLRLSPLPSWAMIAAADTERPGRLRHPGGRPAHGRPVRFSRPVADGLVASHHRCRRWRALFCRAGCGNEHDRPERGGGRTDHQHRVLRDAVYFGPLVPAQARLRTREGFELLSRRTAHRRDVCTLSADSRCFALGLGGSRGCRYLGCRRNGRCRSTIPLRAATLMSKRWPGHEWRTPSGQSHSFDLPRHT